MSNRYHLSDVIKYEKISRDYTKKSRGELDEDNPNPEMLLNLISEEKEFNTGFARYVIDRYLQSLTDYIFIITNIDVSLALPSLKKKFFTNKKIENDYKKWLEDYLENNNLCGFHDIIEHLANNNFSHMMHYFFFSEEKKYIDLLNELRKEKNERKFYILQ